MVAFEGLNPLLVIVGETASGKSDLAVRLAQDLNGEIICADSCTVRKKMDIGSAKPTMLDRSVVVHHLLDIIEPDQDFTAAIFKRLAEKKIHQIIAQNKLPILVGGTGLYIDSIIFNYSFLPPGDDRTRLELEAMSATELLKKINELNLNLGSVDIRNKRRLIRLIETDGVMPQKHPLRESTTIIGLKIDRDELNMRIENRVDKMLKAGLAQEVHDLVNTYGWNAEGLKDVGYAQWRQYFLGQESVEVVRTKIISATRNLAKRQRTWFKRNKSIHWFSTPLFTTKL